jgi:hypothetical protein
MDYSSIGELTNDTFPEPNPTWFKQQESLNTLYPEGLTDFCKVFNNLGGAGGPAVDSGSSGKTEEKI